MELFELPEIKWNDKSIIVFNLNEDPINAFAFFENREDSNSMIMCGDLEDFYDDNKVSFNYLYEMYALSKIIKENTIYNPKTYQSQLNDF